MNQIINKKFNLIICIFLIILIKLSFQNHIQDSKFKLNNKNTNINLITPKSSKIEKNDFIKYIRTTIPNNVLKCLEKFSILRCMKIYLIQKLENNFNTSKKFNNLTKDFFNHIILNNNFDDKNWFNKNLIEISDIELTRRLIINFKNYFKNREIKLHFIPGILVKVIPSKENKLKFSLKKRIPYRDIITAGKL